MQLYNNDLFYLVLYILAVLLFAVWMRLPDSRWANGGNHGSRGEHLTALLFCLCIAGAVGTLLRLFPANTLPPERDSSVFLYMGREMLKGKVPYRDLFDHKGPLLYWLQAIGQWLTPESFTGVWILELLHMAAAILLLYKVCCLVSENIAAICTALLVTFGICGWRIYQGGNFAEEYALPWISGALFVFFRFWRDGRYRTYEIVLLGVGFGAVLLLRANMAGVWLACIPAVLIRLMTEKRFREVGSCVLLFSSGLCVALLPVIIWSLTTDSLQQMWEDYILFNLLYTGESWPGFSAGMEVVFGYLRILWPAVAAILLAPFLPKNRKGLLWLNLWAFAISFLTVMMSGRGYGHYAIVLLPMTAGPFVCILTMIGIRMQKSSHGRNFTIIALSGIIVLAAAVGYRTMKQPVVENEDVLLQFLREETLPEENILILGNSCRYYLLAERGTSCRFFYQTPPIELSEELYLAFIDELKANPPDRIIIPYGEDAENLSGTRMISMIGDLRETARYDEQFSNAFEVVVP